MRATWKTATIQEYQPPPRKLTRTERQKQKQTEDSQHLQEIERLERKLRQIQLKKQRATQTKPKEQPQSTIETKTSTTTNSNEEEGKDPAFFTVLSPPEVVACTECGLEFPLRHINRHQHTNCMGRYVECTQPGCTVRFRETERARHVKYECKTVMKNNAFVLKASKHSIPLSCPLGCSMGVTKKDIPRHVRTVCAKRKVTCPHMGCNLRLSIPEMETHSIGDITTWTFTIHHQKINFPKGSTIIQNPLSLHNKTAIGKLDIDLTCSDGKEKEDYITSIVIRAGVNQIFDLNSDLIIGDPGEGGYEKLLEPIDEDDSDYDPYDDTIPTTTTITSKHLKEITSLTLPRCRIGRNREVMSASSSKRRLEPIKCSPHHNMGCGAFILPKHMKKHEAIDCPQRLMECSNSGCTEKIPFNILSFHEENLCKAMLAKEKLLEQGKMEFSCPLGCGEYLFLSEMLWHKKNECVNRQVTCSTTGCELKMPYHMINNHEMIWDRKIEQASQKFYYVNPDTEETAWEYPGCLLMLKREYYLNKYLDRPKIVLCKLGCRTALKNQVKVIRDHLAKDCPNEMIECPSEGKECTQLILRRDIETHKHKDCKMGQRLMKLARKGMAQRMLINCPYCEVEIQMKHLKRHTGMECGDRLVPCKFWDCKMFVQANGWHRHVLADCEHSNKWRTGVRRARERIVKKGGILLPSSFGGGKNNEDDEDEDEDEDED